MIKTDKSSEPDATAALAKLKKREQVYQSVVFSFCHSTHSKNMLISLCILIYEQEVERKARKQFKGLFDKKPGEIAEVEDKAVDEITGENPQKGKSSSSSEGDESQDFHEAAADEPRIGWFYNLWPTGGRLFSALGLHRCTIL